MKTVIAIHVYRAILQCSGMRCAGRMSLNMAGHHNLVI